MRHKCLAFKVDVRTPVVVSGNSESLSYFKIASNSQPLNSYAIFEINRDKCKKKNVILTLLLGENVILRTEWLY